MPAPFRETWFPPATMQVDRRSDGCVLVTPTAPLEPYIPSIPAVLRAQAAAVPDRTYLAERPAPGAPWRRHSYLETRRDADAFAQWLIDHRVSRSRPVLIISGNSSAHAVVKYGAMSARIPVCPISANYSLMGGDFGRLRHVARLIQPGVVFAEQAAKFRAALEAVDFADAIVVTDDPSALSRPAVSLASVLATPVTEGVTRSVDSIDPDEAAVYMLTSGSTSLPKAVIQTQRMITSNLAQGKQVLGRTAGWHEFMLDWLPWNHVSGAFDQMCVLVSGGTLYIDGGRPMPGRFEETIANIKELAPPFHVNVPAGYAMLADALERDEELCESFFRRLRIAVYGGAALPQALYQRLQDLAVRTVGERIFFSTGYGATETSSGCMSIYFPTEQVGIGLPLPGLTLKLVPQGQRYEVRLRGPMITPGYLEDSQRSRALFDEEGFYCSGDTAQLHDPSDIGKGLKFAGRLAEEFKLATGTWVSAGALRAELLEACSPALTDMLVCGENREYLAVLAWPNPAASLAEADLRAFLLERVARFNVAHPGTSTRIGRMMLLGEGPSVDQHEVSDKGTVNQRVALARRSESVELLYANVPGPKVLIFGESSGASGQ